MKNDCGDLRENARGSRAVNGGMRVIQGEEFRELTMKVDV